MLVIADAPIALKGVHMAIVRLFVLGFLTLITWGIGSGNNGNAAVAAVLFFPLAIALYFLPSIEAKLNESENFVSVFMVNLLTGWTLVGWVVAMAWAHKKTVVTISGVAVPAGPVAPKEDEKVCPYCAEVVKAAAVKCRHCGSAL
jgi:hypothetical protein